MPVAARKLSVEDYLALDAASERRLELHDGEAAAVAGAEPEHNQLKDNMAAELRSRLQKRGCWVMTSDQRVRIGVDDYVYPDVVVACVPEYVDTRPRTLINPELIVEVTSESTVGKDRGDKLAAYTQMASLQEYWIAEPGRALLTQYVRAEDGWRLIVHDDLDAAVRSPHFEVEIPLSRLYALVLGE